MRQNRFRDRGLTLIELVASLVIISIAVLGLMLTTAGVAGRSSNPMIERQATAIAHAYLEEVMVANFCDPDFLTAGQTCSQQCLGSACSAAACGGVGPLKEASRNLYDDVCDYNGLNDSGAEDRNGNGIVGLSLYTVRVTVIDNGISIGSPAISSNSGEVLRIDVSVGHQAMDSDFQLSAFRANAQ
ncbi:MAG: prepilin-type N-terminal cleavage/methylation domain-containing protein [Gammaproteobacteria bacterium]|nr:prepilin-type N-terminal cleavage/methylation domain-containing protein [Gammaproteobacteria bacterium]